MSKFAAKRLMGDLKELKRHPLVGVSAAPLGDDLYKWHCNIQGPEGCAYEGATIHFVLEFSDQYPQKAPNAFFETKIFYNGGLVLQDTNGRQYICLDLFGNLGNVHTEWGKDGQASGWSPTYTVSTILINLQAAIQAPNYFSSDVNNIQACIKSGKQLKCKCGHDGSRRSKYYPPILTKSAQASSQEKKSSVATEDGAEFKIDLSKQLGEATIDELMNRVKQLVASNPALLKDAQALHIAITNSKEALSSVQQRDMLEDFICYGSKLSVADGMLIGYGVTIQGRNKDQFSSPGEHLSLSSFNQGIRNSTLNKLFDVWMPLYINEAHWLKVRQEFANTINNPQLKVAQCAFFEEKAFKVLASIMNNSVVEVMNAKNQLTASDKFLEVYFACYHLLQHLKTPKLVARIDDSIAHFLANRANQTKKTVPNLGEWLIRLCVSDKYTWNHVAKDFVAECDTRNVFWYLKQHRDLSDVKVGNENRAQRVFTASMVSRHLVCFQVRFLEFVTSISAQELDAAYGVPSSSTKKSLKDMYKSILEHKEWNDHFDWLHMPKLSHQERTEQLIASVIQSERNGYHGNNNNNNRRGGNGGGRGRGRAGNRGRGRGRGR